MIAYTLNPDNSINILGGSPSLDTLYKILPDKEFEVFDGEPVQANGKYYLDSASAEYAEQKSIEEKEKARAELLFQYEADKAELIKYINEANAYGDDTEDLKAELISLDEKFDADMAELEGK